jgi:hypothetical protein
MLTPSSSPERLGLLMASREVDHVPAPLSQRSPTSLLPWLLVLCILWKSKGLVYPPAMTALFT